MTHGLSPHPPPFGTLLRIAEKGLYRLLWPERILGEAQAAIEEVHPGIAMQKRFTDGSADPEKTILGASA